MTEQSRPPSPSTPEPLWREVVGDVLRDARQARDETQVDTARRAGVSPQYLSEVERARKEASSEMLAAIAGALDLTLVDLTSAVGQRLQSTDRRPAAVMNVSSAGAFALAA